MLTINSSNSSAASSCTARLQARPARFHEMQTPERHPCNAQQPRRGKVPGGLSACLGPVAFGSITPRIRFGGSEGRWARWKGPSFPKTGGTPTPLSQAQPEGGSLPVAHNKKGGGQEAVLQGSLCPGSQKGTLKPGKAA